MMMTDANGRDVGTLDYSISLDMDLGDTNDFEFEVDQSIWDSELMGYGCRLYIPETEYGGIIGDIEVVTKTATATLTGDTWRGMLTKKIIEPPSGQDHKTVSGELNTILRSLIEPEFSGLFVVPQEDTGVEVSNFQFDRFCTLLDGLEDMLTSVGYRLDIRYKSGDAGESGWVEIQAVEAENYSETIEYNRDNRINYDARDYRRGINHLICAGNGEGTDRTVLHLYVQSDGSVGSTKYYTGLEERVALYSYTSQSDVEQLRKDGTKRLQELMNYKQFEMSVEDVDLEIGDTVSGRDFTTGILVQKPIVQKILKIEKGKIQVEYKLKGDD
jgi:hypothetical protein